MGGQLGMFLGLTGHRLKSWDCLHAGVATHAVTEAEIDKLTDALQQLASSKNKVSDEDIEEVLDNLNSAEASNHTFSLAEHSEAIDRMFGSDSVETIVKLLREE